MGKWKEAASLLLTFVKIGAFTFGGGYAMIPLIQREAVEQKKWITGEELLDIVAVAESTPGPIAINAATFVGYKVAGYPGAVCATFGVVLPSFMIISLLSQMLELVGDNRTVQYAFQGIRAGVLALIVKALVSMYRQSPKGMISYCIMAAAFLAVAILKVHVLLVIACCGLVGLLRSAAAGRRKL